MIDRSIDNWYIPVLRDVLVEILSNLDFLLGKWIIRRKTPEIERASRRSGMRVGSINSGWSYTACAETSEKRGAGVCVCSSHCFCGVGTIDRSITKNIGYSWAVRDLGLSLGGKKREKRI
jgi:hypothetical protein